MFVKRRSSWNCRGSFFDVLALFIFAVILIVVVTVFFIAHKETADSLESSQISIPNFNSSIEVVVDQADRYPAFMDVAFMLMFIVTWLIILASAFLLGNNPVFLFAYVLLSFALVLTGLALQFGLDMFVNQASIFVYAVSFPMMFFVAEHFVWFALLFIVTTGVALYLKPK